MAGLLRIEPEQRADFEEELATGRTKAYSRVAEALYRTAIAGGREGFAAAIFWLKAGQDGRRSISTSWRRQRTRHHWSH